MTDLEQKQFAFSHWVAMLILQAENMGYQVKLGEAWRSLETANLDAQEGKGIKNSEHLLRLAIDICLFKEGAYLTQSEDYRELGEWWKKQETGCTNCWGGDFKDSQGNPKPDGNHFSFEYSGVK